MFNLLFLENNTDQDIIKQKLCRKAKFEYYILLFRITKC